MPIFSYFAVVGSAMLALLFVADATLPKTDAPVIATSSIYGLPKPWKPDSAQTLIASQAPAPDMTSEAVLAAAPKVEPVNERSAKADTPPKKKHVAHRAPRPDESRQNFAWQQRDPGPFGGGGGMFGRF
jgi:hypothetical protein